MNGLGVLVVVVALVSFAAMPGCSGQVCDPAATRSCHCPGTEGAQVCNRSGSAWGACDCDGVDGDGDADADTDVDIDTGADVDAEVDGDLGADAEPDADPEAVRLPPVLESLVEECKLISARNLDDPTANDAHHRANLRGTDLGIPVAHGDDIYFFFGDTAGAQLIWPLGLESLPDAVGYSAVPYAEVALAPALLCENLRFLLTGGATGSVEGDFAGASMTPPPGHSIGEYIHNPAGPRGANMFPNLPGDFEVPTGAFSHGGSIYLFYTIVNLDPLEMRGSYLARWGAPSTGGTPDYVILHHVDERFDASGPLRGDFIHVAPLVVGDHLYLYGTGRYRASPVHLARKPLADLASEGGYERYDAASGAWVAAESPAAPVVSTPQIGELSVRYFAPIARHVMLDQEGPVIVARFSDRPEGPWSEPVVVASMTDPEFTARYCCVDGDCLGERLFNCERAGFYGTYMLPDAIVHDDGSFSIAFFMSTWDPYNVALMTATFR